MIGLKTFSESKFEILLSFASLFWRVWQDPMENEFHLYEYEKHLINEVNFLFRVSPFSIKSVVLRLFMSQKIARKTFFSKRRAYNFFLNQAVSFQIMPVMANPCLAHL